jgi:hypothetical protein
MARIANPRHLGNKSARIFLEQKVPQKWHGLQIRAIQA